MTERTKFLREQTLSGANKCKRTPLPDNLNVSDLPYSLPVRKAYSLKMIFEKMPLFIGEKELIVGTRTYFKPLKDNMDGSDKFKFDLVCYVPYLNDEDIKKFGKADMSNKTHYTPDLRIILDLGIDGLIKKTEERAKDETLKESQRDFLESVKIVYTGLKTLIVRYSDYAKKLSENAQGEDKKRLEKISDVCKNISGNKPRDFYEAVQLLWFAHLGTIIESFQFINYGRLDVILGDFLGDTKREDARQLIECLLLKMYDQVDLTITYLGNYAAQLVVTLGGVLANGENAVNDVTMLFLDAIDSVRLPEPEFNLRLNSKNPKEFLDKAAKLTISGCNFVSYYNDDLFISSMVNAGMKPEIARQYGFDLCQDMNIPGKADFYVAANPPLANMLLDFLNKKNDYETFEELFSDFKNYCIRDLQKRLEGFIESQIHIFKYRDEKYDEYFKDIKEKHMPISWNNRSPMCPLPYLSGLFHGTIENAYDMVFESYEVKEKGVILGTATECVNSLAAIKQVVYVDKKYTLKEVVNACSNNYKGEGEEVMRNILWNAPKWGNDDDRVDLIAKDLLETCLKECKKYKTASGGLILGGIHQPHPVSTGKILGATPEGRFAGAPTAVTLTPESGTMRCGATAVLKSASKLDYNLIQWNFCVMINYFSSVFEGNDGEKIFENLLTSYFKNGGLQHQPNVLNVEELKKAQLEPEKYKDLIVRLWGVSAHFVDLPKELQDEMIARFS